MFTYLQGIQRREWGDEKGWLDNTNSQIAHESSFSAINLKTISCGRVKKNLSFCLVEKRNFLIIFWQRCHNTVGVSRWGCGLRHGFTNIALFRVKLASGSRADYSGNEIMIQNAAWVLVTLKILHGLQMNKL